MRSRSRNNRRIESGASEAAKTNNCSTVESGDIVAIVPRGEVLRNFAYSGTFSRIAESARLALLSVSLDTDVYAQPRHFTAGIYPLNEYPDRWPIRFQREILDMAHGRWLWSRAARERWRLRDIEAQSLTQRAKRMAKKAVCLPFANPVGLDMLSKVERATSRLNHRSHEYFELYARLKPSLVFNGSHIHSRNAVQAVQAAQWMGIPTATFIFSWDNLTSQGRIWLPYDYFLVWNEKIREQLLSMYSWIKAENVFVTGTPQFDFHFRPDYYLSRDEFCEQIGADPSRPIVFYGTGMPNHMPGEPAIVAGIADILAEYEGSVRPQLLVRVYPKDKSERFDQLKRSRSDILFPKVEWDDAWFTPKYEDTYALINTLRHCAVGINVASTLSLELCMFDKPIINVGYNPPGVPPSVLAYADYYEFDHYRPLVESGAVEVARNVDEARTLIGEALRDPTLRVSQRKKLIHHMFGGLLDGQSADRVASTLLGLSRSTVPEPC